MNKITKIGAGLGLISALAMTQVVHSAEGDSALEQRLAKLEAMLDDMSAAKNPFYGSIRVALGKSGDASNTISNLGSRIGAKGSHSIGDGLTALYRLEWGLGGDFDLDSSFVRLGYVGLRGHFGEIKVGEVWGSAYNATNSRTDIFTDESLKTAPSSGYRLKDAVQYEKKFGGVKLSILSQIGRDSAAVAATDTTDAVDAVENVQHIAISGPIGSGADFGVAHVTDAANNKHLLAGISYSKDGLYLAAAVSNQSTANNGADASGFDGSAAIDIAAGTTLNFHYGSLDTDGADRANAWEIGVRKQYSKYNIFAVYGKDDTNASADDAIKIGLRYNF